MEREEGKADGRRVAAARVGCCVLCVFCVLCRATKLIFTHFVTTPGDISPQFLSMLTCSNAPPQHGSHIYMYWGCVTRDKSWGVQLDLAFVFRGKNTPFFGTSVHFACTIENLVL